MSDELLNESVEELYESGPCGYLFTRMDGTILRVNDTLLSWIGRTRDDVVGIRRFPDLLTVPGRLFYENQYIPLLRMQGEVREVALDLSRDGREPLPVLANSVVRTDTLGQPTIIASAFFDATDRRGYERELIRSRRSAEQLAAVVRLSSDAIVSMTPTGIIETWNNGAAQLFGYTDQEMVGKELASLLSSSEDGASWSEILARLRNGSPVQSEMMGHRADGRRVDVSAGFTPHWDLLGSLEGVSVIMRDIAERRAVERLQHEFLAVATHELRSPVTSIRANAQLMQRRASYSERGAEAIIAQSDKLQSLIDDLLLASKIQADRYTAALEETDLVAAVHTAASYLAVDESVIHVEAPEEPLLITADPHRLGQVFSNLLTNAIKYSPDGSEITVRLTRDTHEAHVSVIDRGIGIQPESIPRLFDRFYRATSTTGRIPGLGLGLYVCRRIVEAHGGRIDVVSEPEKGSTFTVSLPLQPPAAK